jgi:MinD-like ATPase involved in chromosome partitioning or flagellar assembly
VTIRRIFPVASGKGGVGKSTFAINFALAMSRVAPTVLVDLDTGTSSIRNTIDAPVERDLYHFFRRDEPLERCLTPLPPTLDRHGRFRDFAFVAAPRHVMEEFTSLSDRHRFRLMRAINTLPATYVVLDLRAGLDPMVLDFLPHSNSGILVFTPHHPAATLAAAEIVKALLFRKLRLVFATDGPLAGSAGTGQHLRMVNALLDRVEDAYDESIPNLDDFLRDLLQGFGDAPLVQALAENVASFGVNFVLNLFDGVRESFDGAIVPFVRSLQTHVSAQLAIHNLGWIVTSPEVHESNCQRRPIVLQELRHERTEKDPILAELERLAGIGPAVPAATGHKAIDYLLAIDPQRVLLEQLEVLEAMHRDTATMQVRDNFAYIARRALHALATLPADRFGQRRLLTPLELFQVLLPRPTPASRAAADDAGEAPLP